MDLSTLEEGETLRDRFAMAALIGLSGNDALSEILMGEVETQDVPLKLAEASYALAAAMMEARKCS